MDTERVVSEVADRVRELIADAERRAEEIVNEAEEEAERIRARAEAAAEERLAAVRSALAEVESRLGSGARAEVEPGPVTVPEPAPDPVPEPGPAPVPEPTPDPAPEPSPPLVPEPTPPPDEGTPPDPQPTEGAAANGAGEGRPGRSADAGAARLVAMNMALAGSTREEIEAALAAEYELEDQAKLVDDVLARVGS